jgi:hypothetical protein
LFIVVTTLLKGAYDEKTYADQTAHYECIFGFRGVIAVKIDQSNKSSFLLYEFFVQKRGLGSITRDQYCVFLILSGYFAQLRRYTAGAMLEVQ